MARTQSGIRGGAASDHRGRALVWGVFVVALATRLLYVGLTPARMTPDSREYLKLAANVREHGTFSLSPAAPYTPTTRRGPLYPLFLLVFGKAARFVQSVLDSFTTSMICFLAGRYVKLRWAAVAGLIYAVHPGAVLFANTILVENLFAFLLSATVVLLAIAVRREASIWAAAAGVTLAMASLCRAIAVPFILVGAAFLLTRRFRMATTFCAAAVLVLAPWVIRSSVLAGRFVPVTSGGPMNFALATTNGPWNLNDQASIYRPYYLTVDPCGRTVADPTRSPRETAQADDICIHEALDNLKRNPGYYARSRLSQLVHFPLTSFDFVTGNTLTLGAALAQRQYGVLATKGFLYAVFSLAPLLMGIAGVLFGTPAIENRLAGALWIFIFLIYAPGFVEYRYFVAAVPMLLVSAAFGLGWRDPSAVFAASG